MEIDVTMITGTRNNTQATIDENCEVIRRLISSVPYWIQSSFEKAEEDAKVIAFNSCGSDKEVYASIFDNIYVQFKPEQEEWMIEEFYRSLVLLICGFAETTMKSMMKRPFDKRKPGVRFIEDSFNQIVAKYDLVELPTIEDLWPQFGLFFDKRNDIAHGYKDEDSYEQYEEVFSNKEELLHALNGAYRLLRSTADAIDIKERGYASKHVNYLWTPNRIDS